MRLSERINDCRTTYVYILQGQRCCSSLLVLVSIRHDPNVRYAGERRTHSPQPEPYLSVVLIGPCRRVRTGLSLDHDSATYSRASHSKDVRTTLRCCCQVQVRKSAVKMPPLGIFCNLIRTTLRATTIQEQRQALVE